MSESRHITETEAEDHANEVAESAYARDVLNGDNFEAVRMEEVTSGLFDVETDLIDVDVDESDIPDDMEFPGLDLCDDSYNDLENY